ncbi:MAG: MFS transporter [Patescibacteria group bacterium]
MLSNEENSLLRLQSFSFFASSLAGIFLQIFLFKLTGFTGVVLYNLCSYTMLLVLYISSGFLLRKYSTTDLIRWGLLTATINYSLIVFLKESSAHFIIIIGLIAGVSNGFFWSGFNLTQYVITHSKNRDHYFGKGFSLINISSALGPLVGGMVITQIRELTHQANIGYYILFLVVILINVYLFLTMDNLPSFTGINFSFKDVFSELTNKKWRIVLYQNFLLGLWDIAFLTLTSILLFIIIQDEYKLGLVRSAMLLLGALIGLQVGKLLAKNRNLYIFGAVGTTLGIIFFALNQNYFGILLYSLLTGVSYPFFSVPFSSVILNTIDDNKEPWQQKYHMFLERDGVLGVARVISYVVLLILFANFDKVTVARNWMILISIMPLILAFLLHKSYKK